MRIIILKEIRENLRWALLLMLVIGAGLASAVYSDAAGKGLVLVGPETSTVTGIAFPAVGCALGLLLVLQDRRRGRWGFVSHRPVSRTAIFFAKAIAGTLLFVVVGGTPLAVAVAWVATPGHVAGPFDWQMALPPLADLIGGLMWLATGLLVAAREARWIGTRLMPVGFALLVTGYAWDVPFHLWQAVLVFIGGTAVVLPAAWVAFVAGDDYDGRPVVCRGLQIVSVGTGLALMVALVLNLLSAGIEWAHPAGDWEFHQYQIMLDGQIVEWTNSRYGPITAKDLAGRPVPLYPGANNLLMAVGDMPLDGFPNADSPWQRGRDGDGLHSADAYARTLIGNGAQRWFYVVGRRTIEGFDIRTGRSVGSIGPDGPASTTETPRPFDGPLYRDQYATPDLLATPEKIYRLDIGRGQFSTLFTAAPGDPVAGLPMAFGDGNEGSRYLAIATRSELNILSGDKPVCQIALDRSDPQYGRLDIGRASNGQFVLHYQVAYGRNGNGPPDRVVVADPDGRIVSRTDLPRLAETVWTEPWYSRLLETLSIPPVLLASLKAIGMNDIGLSEIVIAVVAGLLSAGTMLLIARRYVLPRRASIAWILFAAATGIPGVLVLLAVRPMPARVRCPACNRRRVVTRNTCEHCAVEFSAPPAEGIEVMEAA